MQGLRQHKLTAKKIPEQESLTDDDKAWEFFDELKFDVVLANPPFAGEMKDRKMLSRYDLAKPALKRAKDKAPKEERDVLFIERILKMLKPGGRAAIVLPQGKFNNSSLAFIREWILKKARLLAVVGLHPNTFKPHTGTKTSVLFVQKYTKDELKQIEQVHEEVAKDCPDYEEELKAVLDKHKRKADVPEDDVLEAVMDLMAESFSDPEPEEEEAEESAEDNGDDDGGDDSDNGDRIEQAEQKLEGLQATLVKTKQKLMDLDSDVEALELQQTQEIEAITAQWTGTKTELNKHLKGTKAENKKALKALKDSQKAKKKTLKAEIKALDKAIPDAQYELKVLTTRGKVELILEDPDLIGTLKERWIAAEVAKRLDYLIFMAVSERGGKNNSGNYEHVIDEDGSLVEFPEGHPQEGQLVIDQD